MCGALDAQIIGFRHTGCVDDLLKGQTSKQRDPFPGVLYYRLRLLPVAVRHGVGVAVQKNLQRARGGGQSLRNGRGKQ